MIEVKKLKTGDILSENSYFIVKNISETGEVTVDDTNGNKGIIVSKKYVEDILNSSDQYSNTEVLNRTELINIVDSNPRIAMSIYFQKADKVKPKKAFKAEKQAKIDEIRVAPASKVEGLLMELMDNPILDYTSGEMREIKGYYTGSKDDRGRFQFVDMEDSNMVKGVDSRTIESVIVNEFKYNLKK